MADSRSQVPISECYWHILGVVLHKESKFWVEIRQKSAFDTASVGALTADEKFALTSAEKFGWLTSSPVKVSNDLGPELCVDYESEEKNLRSRRLRAWEAKNFEKACFQKWSILRFRPKIGPLSKNWLHSVEALAKTSKMMGGDLSFLKSRVVRPKNPFLAIFGPPPD